MFMAAIFFISLVISGASGRDPVKLAAPVAIRYRAGAVAIGR